MNWNDVLSNMETAELRDLCGYLYGFEIAEKRSHEELVESLIHGKNRYFFELIDKEAFKTLRRLVRHPDRPINYAHYQVDQLLTLHMIEELPNIEQSPMLGWYKLRDEALPFANKIAHVRHYAPLLVKLEAFEEILMGLFHTFGLLELHQCVEMLAAYGIEIAPQQLFSSISWRLSIREHLQAFQLKQRGQLVSFIILRGLNLSEALSTIMSQKQYDYILCDKEEMRRRSDRYYAMASIEMTQLIEQLKTVFTKRFAIDVAKELIDTYQYHTTTFTKEYMIVRVIEEDEIRPYLELAIRSIPDVYCKGHSSKEYYIK